MAPPSGLPCLPISFHIQQIYGYQALTWVVHMSMLVHTISLQQQAAHISHSTGLLTQHLQALGHTTGFGLKHVHKPQGWTLSLPVRSWKW